MDTTDRKPEEHERHYLTKADATGGFGMDLATVEAATLFFFHPDAGETPSAEEFAEQHGLNASNVGAYFRRLNTRVRKPARQRGVELVNPDDPRLDPPDTPPATTASEHDAAGPPQPPEENGGDDDGDDQRVPETPTNPGPKIYAMRVDSASSRSPRNALLWLAALILAAVGIAVAVRQFT